MGKQAIAAKPLDFEDKMEIKTHTLNYAQRPLVTTWTADLIGMDDEPAGMAAVVAIMCHGGYNQEDSALFNRSSFQRGMFRTTASRVFKDVEISHGADSERFEQVAPDVLGKLKGNYSKLGPDGLAPLGTMLGKDDVLIGKTIEYNMVQKDAEGGGYTTQRVKRDRSILMKTDEECRVDKIMLSATKDDLKFVSIRTTSQREPEIGDKFCLSADHEVLTSEGWLPIPQVTEDHLVAYLHPGRDTVSYDRPTAVYRFPHTEEEEGLVEIESDSVSQRVTKNHRLYVRDPYESEFRYVEAQNLAPVCHFKADCSYAGDCDSPAVLKSLRVGEMWEARDNEDADQLQLASFHAGLVFIVVNHHWLRRVDPQPLVSVNNYRTSSYRGYVYCLEVPTHVFYVRRNGKASWTGNSSRHGSLCLLCAPFTHTHTHTHTHPLLLTPFVFSSASHTLCFFLCFSHPLSFPLLLTPSVFSSAPYVSHTILCLFLCFSHPLFFPLLLTPSVFSFASHTLCFSHHHLSFPLHPLSFPDLFLFSYRDNLLPGFVLNALWPQAEGSHRHDLQLRRHALHARRHHPGHRHQLPRQAVAHDHRPADGVLPRQGQLHDWQDRRRHALPRRQRCGHRPGRQALRLGAHGQGGHVRWPKWRDAQKSGVHRGHAIPASSPHGPGQGTRSSQRPDANPDAPARGRTLTQRRLTCRYSTLSFFFLSFRCYLSFVLLTLLRVVQARWK